MLAWTRVAQRLIGPLRDANPDMVLCFDTIDVNHVREYRHARVSGNANILRRALAIKQAELAAVAACDMTIAISDHDAQTLQALAPEARIEVITLAVEPRHGPCPGPEGRRGALYLGNYMAWHNVDAVTHIARDIAPILDRLGSSLPMIFAGAGMHELVEELASERISIAGFVPDIEAEMDRRRMFVAPLRVGSGIKGKLLGALAAGLPVVATPVAAEGIPLVDGVSALIAATDAEFAAACARLEVDDALWRRLSAGATAVVADHFSPAIVRAQVASVFGDMLAQARPGQAAKPAARLLRSHDPGGLGTGIDGTPVCATGSVARR